VDTAGSDAASCGGASAAWAESRRSLQGGPAVLGGALRGHQLLLKTPPKETAAEDEAKGKEEELAALKKKLEAVSKEKAAAAEAENFKEAKRLKTEQQELQDKIAKLEL